MDVHVTMAVEPSTLAGLAARWQEAAELLDASRREVAALDPSVFAGVADGVLLPAARGFRDDLVRRAAAMAGEAAARAEALQTFRGEIEREDDEVARALEGRR